MIQEKRLIDRFAEYVQIDSETKSEGAFAGFLADQLGKMGLSVAFDKAGDLIGSDGNNLVARLEGTIPGEPIIFCAHMDTVVPGKGIVPRIKDGVITSSGDTILASDDKGGIAAIMEAVQMVIESNVPHRTIEVVFTIAEEGGLSGAKNMDMSLISGTKGFVLDSGGSPGSMIVGAPYQDKVEARIIGRPAHAGICPEEGISAIQVVADAIQRMNLLRIDEETTANIGIIKGGDATNIVCSEVYIKAEARSLNEEKLVKQTQHMVRCIEEACGKFHAKPEIEVTREYDGYSISDDEPLLKFAERAIAEIGLVPVKAKSGGGSDTNVFNNRGIKLLNLATGMSKVHTLDEYVTVKDMVDLTRLVYQLATSWNL